MYTVSSLASRAVPFLLLPILTRFLTPADYGVVAMFLLAALVVEPFITLNLAGAVTVKYYDKSTDFPAYVGTGMITVAGMAVAALLLLVALQDPISAVTSVPAPWIVAAVPLVFARGLVANLLAILRVREQAVLFGLLQNLQTAIVLVLAIALVVILGADWRGRVGAELVAVVAIALAGVAAFVRSGWIRATFVRRYASDAARFGIPLIPHTLGAVLILQTDRLLLTNMVGVHETGLYAAGFQLALIVEVVAWSFNNAYAPWLYRRLAAADGATRRELVRLTYAQFLAMAAFALAVALTVPWLASVVLGERFAASGRYVPWFALGFLFSAMYYMVTNYLFYARKTGWLAAVTITTAVANIPLAYALISLNGAIGAAQATAISLGVSFLLTWFFSQRAYPMPWLLRRGRS